LGLIGLDPPSPGRLWLGKPGSIQFNLVRLGRTADSQAGKGFKGTTNRRRGGNFKDQTSIFKETSNSNPQSDGFRSWSMARLALIRLLPVLRRDAAGPK
jgi:hypothetical protein